MLHEWISIAFCVSGLITYAADVKWMFPFTVGFYVLYFISTALLMHSRKQVYKNWRQALKKTFTDICVVSVPIVAAIIALVRKLIN